MSRKRSTAVMLAAIAALAALVPVSLSAGATTSRSAPRSFFGIVPQTPLSETDARYMRAGGIGSVRWPLSWGGTQPEAGGVYQWGAFDEAVATAARQRLRVLPFAYSTPSWVSRRYTVLPVGGGAQRAWVAFLRAAVRRYGPGGSFWREHGQVSGEPLPELPIREWQIWNEANFFYFARPVSPSRYARLLKASNRAIKGADPGAKTIVSGLFGEPNAKPPNAMRAVQFLERLYRVPGIKASFDGYALHPYAGTAADLRRMSEEMRRVALRNHDAGARFYITEMGWGSQNHPNLVSFERGTNFQLRQMRFAYRYLTRNRRRLNLHGAYWFTWKDIKGSCNFCDSTGLFGAGERLKPKPAWRAFVRITGGRPRP
jgi:polysaccharide biosynthesis protein PslG